MVRNEIWQIKEDEEWDVMEWDVKRCNGME